MAVGAGRLAPVGGIPADGGGGLARVSRRLPAGGRSHARTRTQTGTSTSTGTRTGTRALMGSGTGTFTGSGIPAAPGIRHPRLPQLHVHHADFSRLDVDDPRLAHLGVRGARLLDARQPRLGP